MFVAIECTRQFWTILHMVSGRALPDSNVVNHIQQMKQALHLITPLEEDPNSFPPHHNVYRFHSPISFPIRIGQKSIPIPLSRQTIPQPHP
jgi:hypothetical protein